LWIAKHSPFMKFSVRRGYESWLGTVMQRSELRRMGVEDLWGLHLEISEMLGEKLEAKRKLVEERIERVRRKLPDLTEPLRSDRRPYPPVLPKFRNPDQPSETWAGRGKKPRWLTKQLRAGRRLDDFRI
jgi:DNA-binding protein H-NS